MGMIALKGNLTTTDGVILDGDETMLDMARTDRQTPRARVLPPMWTQRQIWHRHNLSVKQQHGAGRRHRHVSLSARHESCDCAIHNFLPGVRRFPIRAGSAAASIHAWPSFFQY
jgi:hypothetical protein